MINPVHFMQILISSAQKITEISEIMIVGASHWYELFQTLTAQEDFFHKKRKIPYFLTILN